MNKESFILPVTLSQDRPTGLLDTLEKVRQASDELRTATASAFEDFRISKQRSLEESTRRFLD
jgi:hypothetical protein